MRRFLLTVGFVLFAVPAAAQQPRKADSPAPPSGRPWFVDDKQLFDDFMEKLTELARAGKCLDHDKLVAKMKPGRAKITPAKAGDRVMSAEEIYKHALPSVFVVGSVYKDKCGEWQDGMYATAWVAAADGVLVTNWHVFEELEAGEVFGALDHKGNVYPVVDILGGDKVADIAVIRIDARGLTPLPVAESFAEVGSWVGVLGHPGDNFYIYTQGHVTRYSQNKNDDGKRERWMGVTAEYAGGSSGSPVLNKHGAVVGMAALTLTLDAGDGGQPRNPGRRRPALRQPPEVAPPPRPKGGDANEAPRGSSVQMVVRMAVPGPTILRTLGK
jgi:S1-C subfamily serine protease